MGGGGGILSKVVNLHACSPALLSVCCVVKTLDAEDWDEQSVVAQIVEAVPTHKIGAFGKPHKKYRSRELVRGH